MYRKIKHFIIYGLVGLFTFNHTNAQSSSQEETYIEYNSDYIKNLGEDTGIDEKLSLNTFKERFDFLNANTHLNIDYNDITYQYVKKYLSYRWYGKIIGLSAYYFPLFEAKLSQYGLPLELKYLAVVESALNPRTQSWAGAKGLWQFMPATGAQMGLSQNQYVNTFYDPVANTDAAARYLRYLYKEFGDWNLAISAYNCGPGNVRKAIKKAGSKSYWKVRPYLPAETRAYVPSFIAVNYLFNFYKEHNFKPMYFKYNFFDLKMIKINNDTSFSEMSKFYDYSIIKFANPQFITDKIPAGSIMYVK